MEDGVPRSALVSAADSDRVDIGTLAGMATCTITHMLELTASREVVGAAIGRSHPQALIRVGLAPTFGRIPPPTPRRSLADVLEIRS
ncbi:putative NAD(P)H nitroreductase acg [Mycobacteroides abscessus subsp. abscessus]|nr:putative NAD(P)H nitroreductase acg [Mycobacteroides abscessus subsp. abscessus]